VTLKEKIYQYMLTLLPNGVKKIPIEAFFHLPPVSTTPVVHLQLRIFEKNRNSPNSIIRGLGETDPCRKPSGTVPLNCASTQLRPGPFGVKKVLAPSKKPLEITYYLFCPHKKITSRTIRISGGLIVKKSYLIRKCTFDRLR
jgi:hypothetical protein